jgi:hypothetical protein
VEAFGKCCFTADWMTDCKLHADTRFEVTSDLEWTLPMWRLAKCRAILFLLIPHSSCMIREEIPNNLSLNLLYINPEEIPNNLLANLLFSNQLLQLHPPDLAIENQNQFIPWIPSPSRNNLRNIGIEISVLPLIKPLSHQIANVLQGYCYEIRLALAAPGHVDLQWPQAIDALVEWVLRHFLSPDAPMRQFESPCIRKYRAGVLWILADNNIRAYFNAAARRIFDATAGTNCFGTRRETQGRTRGITGGEDVGIAHGHDDAEGRPSRRPKEGDVHQNYRAGDHHETPFDMELDNEAMAPAFKAPRAL